MITAGVLVALAGVAPHVLVYAEDTHRVEPGWVIDQDPLAFGQDRVVRGVPGNTEAFGDARHRQVPDHDPFECPPQPGPGDLRSWFGRGGGVLPPHMTAPGAPVPADRDQQSRGAPAQRFMGQFPGHGVTRDTLTTAPPAPLVRLHDPAGQHGTVGFEPLAHCFQAEHVQTAEGSQVRVVEQISAATDGSVVHVEVFRDGRVGTSILGRPRPLPPHRRATRPRDMPYTLIYEEPLITWAH